jgi:hypothetical protein
MGGMVDQDFRFADLEADFFLPDAFFLPGDLALVAGAVHSFMAASRSAMSLRSFGQYSLARM